MINIIDCLPDNSFYDLKITDINFNSLNVVPKIVEHNAP